MELLYFMIEDLCEQIREKSDGSENIWQSRKSSFKDDFYSCISGMLLLKPLENNIPKLPEIQIYFFN